MKNNQWNIRRNLLFEKSPLEGYDLQIVHHVSTMLDVFHFVVLHMLSWTFLLHLLLCSGINLFGLLLMILLFRNVVRDLGRSSGTSCIVLGITMCSTVMV